MLLNRVIVSNSGSLYRMGRVWWWPNALGLLCLCFAFALFYKKWHALTLLEPNQCSMTFMWRRIYYLDVDIKHEAYSLLLYVEGSRLAQKYGERVELGGFPIIFVPGNAGSGRQVRSLGSLLQNKTDLLGTHFHFDTFALDFNGEMSALNFDYIERQAKFLSASIDHILSLYSPHILPKIVLIGHSMGGIVIQKMLAGPIKQRKNIGFIITFATPFSQPPLMLDKRFLRFWDSMNSLSGDGVGRLELDGNNKSAIPKIVSVSGGLLDEFIDEGWTNSPAVNVHAHSTAIDRIWAEADHLCIVWCNEIVRQTSRFLFDYAASPKHFLDNFQDFAHLHYHSLGIKLNPITTEPTILTDVNISLCAPKCPFSYDFQQVNLSMISNNRINSIGKRRHFLLAIANLTNSDNSVPKFDLLTLSNCAQLPQSVGGTRFLDKSHLFAFANLSNCGRRGKVLIARDTNLWVFDDTSVSLPEVHLSFADFIWSKNLHMKMINFSMEMQPLAIIPIQFTRKENEFGIFRVEIWRQNCREKDNSTAHRRIVFFADGFPRRFDKLGAYSNPTSLLIYPNSNGQNQDDSHYQLMLIDTAQCATFSVVFSADFRFSLIRLFRRNQQLLPASALFAPLFVHFYVSITADIRRFVHSFVLPISVLAAIAIFGTDAVLLLLVVNVASFLFLHLLLLTVCPLILAFPSLFSPSVPLRVALLSLLALSTISTNNSFPLALFCVCLHISALHRRFIFNGNAFAFSAASLLLIFPVIIFQLPHTFTYAWNLAKYGQICALSDPFLATNLSLSLISFIALFRISSKLSDSFLHKFIPIALLPFCLITFYTLSTLIIFRPPITFVALDGLSFLDAIRSKQFHQIE